jgi:hypothetical protein
MLRTLAKTLGLEEDEPEKLTDESQASFMNVGTPRATEGHGEHDTDSEHEAQGEPEALPTEKKSPLPTPEPAPVCRRAKPGGAVKKTEAPVDASTTRPSPPSRRIPTPRHKSPWQQQQTPQPQPRLMTPRRRPRRTTRPT